MSRELQQRVLNELRALRASIGALPKELPDLPDDDQRKMRFARMVNDLKAHIAHIAQDVAALEVKG